MNAKKFFKILNGAVKFVAFKQFPQFVQYFQ